LMGRRACAPHGAAAWGALPPVARRVEAHELVATKRAGERVELTPELRDRWLGKVRRALAALDEALATSPLPEEAPNAAEVEAWLLELRRKRF
jgi:uncharacterized protein